MSPSTAPRSSSSAPYWLTFRWAWEGIAVTWRTQRNMKVHLSVAAAVVVVGLWLALPPRDWAILALTIGLVLAAETANTAIEALVDLVWPQPHPLAKLAKDAAAGTVLLLAATSVAVGLLILGPPLWQRLTVSH